MIRRRVWRLGLLACAAAAWAQSPTPEETGAAIEKSRTVALAYTHSLPDFVCTQLVHRYTDLTHRGLWRGLDTLTIKLSYFDQKEDHRLVLVNGTPSEKSYVDLNGAVTTGEFGGMLQQVFNPASQAVFTWEKWTKVGTRRAAIYVFHVDEPHSRFGLNFRQPSGVTHVIVGFRGTAEVDRETGEVLRLTYAADAIPKTYPIRLSTTSVNYDLADVGGTKYLLPASSEIELRSNDIWAQNRTEFREYRKFSADSTIRFGDGK